MKKIIVSLIIIFFVAVAPASAQQGTTVTIVHFSDYHAHAMPFYTAGQADAAGIARAIAYLKALKPDALVFNGGDMLNIGAMGWSDKYQCAEWPWFNGLVDAMAYGNHDADYGPDVFAACRSQIKYPILSANTLAADGQPFFQYEGKPYQVFTVNGVKIGVFALAGADFERLIKPELRPAAGVTFADPLAAAAGIVKTLREQEKVNAVVLIGHSAYEENVTLAQTVPGIDLILGTHSHRQEELTQLPNTATYFISPFQYLTFISRLELSFDKTGKLTGITGRSVPMTNDLPQDPATAQKVKQMQADLEADPKYAPLFAPIGQAAIELTPNSTFNGESLLGNLVMDIFCERSQANMALNTSSSFRQALPPGIITQEILRAAMPYPNKIFVFTITGAQLEKVLNYAVSRQGSDFFPQVSGVRFNIVDKQAVNIHILSDPANPASYAALDPAATYKVATSDFVGLAAAGYKDVFANTPYADTSLEIRAEVTKYFQAHNSPVSAKLDGRITQGAAPATLPVSGGMLPLPLTAPVLGLGLIVLGWWLARRRVKPDL